MKMGRNGVTDWQTAKLGDVVELFDHQRVPLNSRQRQERQGEYPYYGAQGVIDYIDDYIFNGRYILVAEDGENLNSNKLPLALFADGKFWVNNHAHILRGKRDVADDTFLLACLNNADIKPFVTGAAQPKLSQANLRQIEIPLPPLPVQRRIGGILSAYDELIENNQQRIRILEEMTRAVYREWFVEFRFPGHEKLQLVPSPAGHVPKGWERKAMSDCVEINPRLSISKDSEKPFAAMGSLANNSMLITDIKSRTGNGGSKFQNGDTLFARITPCLENGKTGFVQFLPDAYVVALGSTEFIVLRSRTVTPEFVYCLARSDEVRGAAIKTMTGASGRQRVQDKCFDTIQVAHPPRALLDRFTEVVAPSFKLIQTLFRQSCRLREARDLLLPRLISGALMLN